ncbi:hypothetical protein [Spirosoma sp.]|uniref:hypothetical protein n=1 Tax=Spirosoma sp. TaxID=1899569 RepID=UPI003B3A1CE6
MKRLKFDIPGLDLNTKLNSKETYNQEKIAALESTFNLLISELVTGQFKLVTKVINNNAFSISIAALPSHEEKIYQINFDVGLFKWIYDGLYIVLSNNNVFTGLGKASSKFHIPTFNVPDWNSLDLAMANNDEVFFDADRLTLHDFLYTLCLSFIIRHEIRHIANGHVVF